MFGWFKKSCAQTLPKNTTFGGLGYRSIPLFAQKVAGRAAERLALVQAKACRYEPNQPTVTYVRRYSLSYASSQSLPDVVASDGLDLDHVGNVLATEENPMDILKNPKA